MERPTFWEQGFAQGLELVGDRTSCKEDNQGNGTQLHKKKGRAMLMNDPSVTLTSNSICVEIES